MMAAKKKEVPTPEKEVKRDHDTEGNVTTDTQEPDSKATAEAKELDNEAETDDKDNDLENGFFGPYRA